MKMTLSITFKNATLNIMTLSITVPGAYAESCYTECQYAAVASNLNILNVVMLSAVASLQRGGMQYFCHPVQLDFLGAVNFSATFNDRKPFVRQAYDRKTFG